MDLGVLGYYRQMLLRSSDVDERDVFYMLFEHVSTLRPSGFAFSTLQPSASAFSTLRAFWALALSLQLLPFGPRPTAYYVPLPAAAGSMLLAALRDDWLKAESRRQAAG
jgi:hypothetical protein